MTDPTCQPLSDHLAERKANGLVDIKFFLKDEANPTVHSACAEAGALFDAIERGRVKPFEFRDRPAMVGAA